MLPPRDRPTSRRRGTALVVTIIFLLLLGATAATIATVTRSQGLASADQDALGDALIVADNGIARARVQLEDQLTTGATYSALTLNTATAMLTVDGAAVTVERLASSGKTHTFRLRSVGTTDRGARFSGGSIQAQTRTIEVIIRIEEPTPTPTSGPGMGAIVANGDVELAGNIKVDGNDHYASGGEVGITGKNVPAVTSTGTVDPKGSSSLGGSGVPLGPGPYEEGVRVDNNTTAWDPESDASGDPDHDTNGRDDDGDGVVDEDGFPDRVGEFFGMPNEDQLKAKAQADGTYFRATGKKADLTAYDAWLTSTTEAQRGGKIVFIEIDAGAKSGQLNLPSNPKASGARPTLLIVISTNPLDNTIEIGPVHVQDSGTFQGVLVSGGSIKNMNANGRILGSVLAMGQHNTMHKIGNGGIRIDFSSEVVRDLPGVKPNDGRSPPPELLLWRVVP